MLLTPGVTLTLGADLPAVRLVGGPQPADAATISTGGGRLVLRGVTVASLDPRTGGPLPAGPGRPYVAVSAGGRIESTDSALTDLGTGPAIPAAGPACRSAPPAPARWCAPRCCATASGSSSTAPTGFGWTG